MDARLIPKLPPGLSGLLHPAAQYPKISVPSERRSCRLAWTGRVLFLITNHTKREPTTMRTFLIILWGVDAFGALVRVEYFDSAQPQNAWVKVLVTDEGARVRAVCVYGVQDEAKTDSQSAEFASAVEDAQAWLPRCPESVEFEGVTLVPVSTSVFSYDGNDSRLLQVSSDGSGSSLTYGAAGFVNSVASWGSAGDSAVSFSLLCASTDGRVLAAGGAPASAPEFGVPLTGAAVDSAAGFDASVMHPLVWDENSFVPRVLGVAGSSMPSVGSLVPGAGSGAGLLDPYGWASLGVAAPAVPSAQDASAGAAPVLPDSLVGVSAASGVVLGSTGFEVLGARVVDSRVARFTAPDPLAAPVGAGWGADPFSLVGGNPVSLVDPWGLSPVSVEEFEKQKAVAASVRNVLEYVAGGAMVIAGTVIGVIGAGAGPFGGAFLGGISGALMGAGMSVIEQKMSGGKVDWSKVKDEGIKAGISGAVTGLVTGGLGNLKKLADGVTKVTEVAEKVSWLTKMKQATSAVASKATAPFKPFGKNLGAFMKESKVFEDVIKDSLSGGINNVISYYRDDNIKDKNLSDAFTMFTFGAGTAAAGANVSGVAKTRFGVKGYAPEPDYSSLPKHIQKEIQKSQEGFWPRTAAKSKNVFLNAGIDATVGAGKNGVQYISELPIKKQEFSGRDMMDKIVGGFSKDFIKSTLKGSMKISDERAAGFRHSPVTTTRKTTSELRNGFKENVSNGYDWTMVRVLSWVI